MTELEKPGTGAETTRSRNRDRRWPAVVGGLVIVAFKSEAVVRLVFHRGGLIGVLAVVLVSSLLRARPIGVAITSALLVALVLGAHSLGLGLTLGLGGFALLMTLFFAISTVLHARQDHWSSASRG